ncbi:MAG: radical SAM protein [Nitrospirota bacterium]
MKKVSNYNHIYPWHNGYYVAYNARSGGLALLTPENVAVLEELYKKLRQDGGTALSDDEKNLLDQLMFGSFVYDDPRSEIDILHFQHMIYRYDQTELGLTIAPTLACNMACKYCYEGNKEGLISDEVISSIYKLLEEQGRYLSKFGVIWFGGEPLLAHKKIEQMSEQFLSLSQKHDFDYTAQLVSNGYLLTPDLVDRLGELKVKRVQITLDGPSRIHNEKRPLKNGGSSFEKIVENIKYATTRMAVAIRVNIDMTFTSEIISEMLDELSVAGLKSRAGLYFGMVEPVSEVCGNIAESCYSNRDFSKLEIELYSLLLNKGFSINYIPRPCAFHCMAQTLNSFIVDPAGNLYRCLGYTGNREKSMGNIADEIDYSHPNFTRLFQFNPFDDPTCRVCSVLPICMGGCPSRRQDRKLAQENLCGTWKHRLPEMLDIIARSRQQKAKSIV